MTEPSGLSVSVLIPSLNYGRFLRDAVESSLAQVVPTEVVVQDGGSEDESLEVLRKCAHPNVRWHSQPDGGQSDALNRAFRRATGRWIGWLNADEFYLPGGLQRLVEAGERSGADVVFGDCVFVDVDGRILRLVPQHRFSQRLLRWYGCYIASCATVFRRDVLGDRPWDPDVHRIMDWDLYLRLAGEGRRFLYLPYPVGAFRVHEGRITAQPLAAFQASYDLVRGRYGLPRSRSAQRVGRVLHGMAKARDGAYIRQIRARSLRGRDLRWFATAEGRATARELLAVYGMG